MSIKTSEIFAKKTKFVAVLESDPVDFLSAVSACNELGLTLAKINSFEELQAVSELATREGVNFNDYWVGVIAEELGLIGSPTGYSFVDGSKSPYLLLESGDPSSPWQEGQPSNSFLELCVEGFSGAGGRWNNNDCSETSHFICSKALKSEINEISFVLEGLIIAASLILAMLLFLFQLTNYKIQQLRLKLSVIMIEPDLA